MNVKDKALACRLMKAHVLEALEVLRTMPELQNEGSDNDHCLTGVGM